MSESRLKRFALVVPVVALLVLSSFEAYRAAAADRLLSQARRAIASWSDRAPPAAGAWRAVVQQLEQAEDLQGGNPATQELIGLATARRTDEPALAGQAVERHARALARRPVSANGWANFAEAKYLQGDTGPLFETALATSARLGPSDPQVQRMVTHYGLALWDEVGPATRQAIDAALLAGMRRNPMEMLQIAQRRGRLDIACRHLAGAPRQRDPKWSLICQSTEARQ